MRKRLIAAVVVLFIATSFSGSGQLQSDGVIEKTPLIPIAAAFIETEKPSRLFDVYTMIEEKADKKHLILEQKINNKALVSSVKEEAEESAKKSVPEAALSSRSAKKLGERVAQEYLLIENADGQMIKSDITREAGIKAIDAYFEEKDAPLAGYGNIFVEVSQKVKLDWRLLPAISFRESTGGKELFRSYNPFGWGRENFDSFNEAIETVGRNLAGLDPDTSAYYKNKTVNGKLGTYNNVIETYPEEAWGIMRDIEEKVAQ